MRRETSGTDRPWKYLSSRAVRRSSGKSSIALCSRLIRSERMANWLGDEASSASQSPGQQGVPVDPPTGNDVSPSRPNLRLASIKATVYDPPQPGQVLGQAPAMDPVSALVRLQKRLLDDVGRVELPSEPGLHLGQRHPPQVIPELLHGG